VLEYRSFKEIIDHPGLRIVLVKGAPSKLYDRTKDEISLDEVERIKF
jgi:hypothetical protein